MNKILSKIVFPIIETLLRPWSGGLGQRIRRAYYRHRFAACGSNVRIDEGVVFHNPESIHIGNDVWIQAYTLITGRGSLEIKASRKVKQVPNPRYEVLVGDQPTPLRIGNETTIGPYNILHAYGGLIIGDRVTTSARVSVYSFSHYPNDPDDPARVTYASGMIEDAPVACVESPIVLEHGVWIGLGATVFGGCVGRNTFVSAGSIVLCDLEENSFAKGHPAKRVRARFAVE